MNEITTQVIQANGINLRVALAGPKSGNPVILLHGFPDASFGWNSQILALAQAGFYVIAPDQRGYNLSDKPEGVENYRVEILVADILALADALHLPQFNLAGHDWGAMVSWSLAASHPQRVKRLAILNVPHPRVMNRFLQKNWRQRLNSWYIFFFQIRALPEIALGAFDGRLLARQMCKSLSKAEIKRYRAAWAQPGAMKAMINWYRALFQSRQPAPREKIQMPVLVIWGKKDAYLVWQMAQESIEMCENGRLEIVEDATHWVHQDRPKKVNQLLINHFSGW